MASGERTSVWPAVHDERRALHQDLAGVPPERWSRPSPCPGWDVHDVVAHLIDSSRTTRWGFARRMVAARLDFDRDNAAGIARERRADPAETLAAFARVITMTRTPPAPAATRLVEAVVHGEDVRRPLGLVRQYPDEAVLPALRHQLRTSIAIGGGRQLAAGFRVVALDADLVSGAGPELRGTALALLLAVSGRPVGPDELSGPAASAFRQRLSGRA
ncbi:hypothetical protein C5B94_13905 [Clavibacter michiganensis]|uniref:maleylpyruvate isomerase family mycothiol-dependent enzyme n=1 Tax=Clavibacter michiganensis TaxID=28447 RepID=UPI000CE8EBEB|nr:maleylpyruvate isomerase family mycothiol-dependent enzyme [Clavibacter michiganensis]PPF51749.1 hypothetical protein C5B94_13905 [Clavibacter michiganensis]